MTNFPTLRDEILDHAYATVPLSITSVEIGDAIQMFMRFLALPIDVKERCYFQIQSNDRGSEVGYRRYLRDTGQTDNREYVHYHTLAEERFVNEREDIPELHNLLNNMRQIHDAALATLREVLVSFDTVYPGLSAQFFSPTQPGNFYLRFLKYDNLHPGAFLAKGHYDRGSCTLAIAESAPGLRMGIDTSSLHEVAHHEGEALFFPSLTFPELTHSDFKPTWHDVIQKDSDTFSSDTARWAIVLFADTHTLRPISYEEAHTPITN